ncbi:MAG: amylo-alpha-1,6-glucosidase [Desulfobacterales bacterium]|nr:amylo-alpha-1,6-glucosidase [Desulfobacterales bacterium]
MEQTPATGSRQLLLCGDSIRFELTLPRPDRGSAWVRTNLGRVGTTRREIIMAVERQQAPLAHDWHDLPMRRVDEGRFEIVLPLHQVGHFEAKCYFLGEGQSDPMWPPGQNTVINVEPAETCCANVIYNAFVRQFGPNRSGDRTDDWGHPALGELDNQGFAVIPPSGTFRDLVGQLDFIIGKLGCTHIQLLPIHPTPTTYARMGRFGSPYAALSFIAVDPALAEFDPAATPLEQFGELVDAIHRRNAKLLLDIAINHTGWAAALHGLHPEWLVRDPEGEIERPGAWGVTWEDLTRLDYRRRGLWTYMADVFLTWCRRGADGFRCDAGYMIPLEAWRYIVAKVREQFPDTLFFLEGLGGKISVTRDILDRANFNWAYSELFQNYDRRQIEDYLPGALEIARTDGLVVHFAETHDNPRLAARSRAWARMRTALCALMAPHGAFAFANGVEWFAREKIVVHESPSLNWGAETNQVDAIGRLTALLKHHPAFHDQAELTLIQANGGNVAVMRRHHRPSGRTLVIAANLDDRNPASALWARDHLDFRDRPGLDLLSGKNIPLKVTEGMIACPLEAGQVVCLTADPEDLPKLQHTPASIGRPPRAVNQSVRALVLDIVVALRGMGDIADLDIDQITADLQADPAGSCRRWSAVEGAPRTTLWTYPHDLKRQVMVPPGHLLLIVAPHPFRARLKAGDGVLQTASALPAGDGTHFTVFRPLTPRPSVDRHLDLSLYPPQGDVQHSLTPLRYLGDPGRVRIRRRWRRETLPAGDSIFLATNGRGGMCHTPIYWGRLYSRYDALLAANLSPDVPEDRWVMLTRIRTWVVFQGYSQELRHDLLERVAVDDDNTIRWRFRVPAGQGESVCIEIALGMRAGENALRMTIKRSSAGSRADALADNKSVRLILRPDIEDRNFHETTKAFTGPEDSFPAAVASAPGGFDFAPDTARRLHMRLSRGQFVIEPEWTYMVPRPLEAERGLDPHSDLFSPGYFQFDLEGEAVACLDAAVLSTEGLRPSCEATPQPEAATSRLSPEKALRSAMEHYIVRRGDLATVIAGYPWFLDWGRDTLIFVRGLIAAEETELAETIIRQFARFEDQGTLPNMIRGEDARNRNTSDAPLWLFTACRDLLNAGQKNILDMRCGRRSLSEILIAMGHALCAGTPNGVHMDAASGLLFSPSHFTWMDTNHPAGTPREGYPIEIQALWHAALDLLTVIDPGADRDRWAERAQKVRAAVRERYFIQERGYLADVLTGPPGCPADDARVDDALRPNQLFALTLGVIAQPAVGRQILQACEKLLVPGGIRSLADGPVSLPLEIHHQGQLLGDPQNPYRGRYTGDEDTRRKPAYHNGTAWTWVFPSFCEAWFRVYGPAGRAAALAWLGSAVEQMQTGCLGHIAEILDGDRPHLPRGCDAQAWSASEVLRVWRLLTAAKDG